MSFIKRVCCLYRVSTEKQVEKNDIPMQRTACQEFVEQKNWKIVEEHYEKGVSGYKISADDRDAIQDIKQSALAGNFDVLLVFMFDRIGRREDETPFVVQFFVKQGVQVWSTQEGEQRFDNHVDKLMNYIRFWQASGESEKTSIRTKTRMGQMVKEGKFKGGIAPYGYRLEKTGRTNKRGNEVYDIFIDDYESTIIKLIFQKYALEGMGTHQLAMHLTESGMLPRKGISWHPSTLLHLLKNIQYQGILRSGNSQSEVFPDLKIIEDTLFNKVQKLIQARSKKSDPRRTEPMSTLGKTLLSGNCFCAHCGGRLTPSTGGGKRKLSDGTVVDRTRNRYSCYNKTRKRKECDGQTTYEASKIDALVEDTVRLILTKLKSTPKDALTGSLEQTYLRMTGSKKNLAKSSEKVGSKKQVSRNEKLSVSRQCELLGVNRSSVYYTSKTPEIEKLEREEYIKRRIDYWHTKHCYMGVRKLRIKLWEHDGIQVGRKRIRRLMDEMGLCAVYPKPNLSKRNKAHKIFPYLLRNLPITTVNQVWAVNITYIPIGKTHMYLTTIIDWHSRFVVGYELSDSLDTAPVLTALGRAIQQYGKPGIINSDQGCQFTSREYTQFLANNNIRQSMDGKARWVDNVIIERWFRNLKCENIYTWRQSVSSKSARAGIYW